ncbi:MAG: hypothetical protein V7694_20085 [Rhodococcus sp. (in: high G+C Gram-positive bacteria)]
MQRPEAGIVDRASTTDRQLRSDDLGFFFRRRVESVTPHHPLNGSDIDPLGQDAFGRAERLTLVLAENVRTFVEYLLPLMPYGVVQVVFDDESLR